MNVGQLFREFNEYRHLFDGDKTIDENINVFTREKLRDFLKIVPDESLVLDKLKIFVTQQYKKLSKSKEQKQLNEKMAHESIQNEPMVNEPTVNEPTVNEPMVNEPTVNEPMVNEPTVNEPMVNEPTNTSNKIYLNDGVYLSIEGNKRTLIFPDYKIIY
jgi:preprotein translocase subunit SecD